MSSNPPPAPASNLGPVASFEVREVGKSRRWGWAELGGCCLRGGSLCLGYKARAILAHVHVTARFSEALVCFLWATHRGSNDIGQAKHEDEVFPTLPGDSSAEDLCRGQEAA